MRHESKLPGWYDATGKLLRTENIAYYPAGAQQITLSTDGLPTGLLLLRIALGDQQGMRHAVKL